MSKSARNSKQSRRGHRKGERADRKQNRPDSAPLYVAPELAQTAAAQAVPHEEPLFPDPMALLRAALRRWLLCFTLGLLVAGAVAAALWYLLPPGEFRASALVRLHAHQPKVLFKAGADGFRSIRDTHVALIKSPVVLNKALDNRVVARAAEEAEAEDPLEWLSEKVSTRFVGGEVLQVSATHDDPQVAAAIVNSVLDAYFSEVIDRDRSKQLERMRELEDLVAEYEQKVKDQRRSLKELQERLGTTDSEAVRLQFEALKQHVSALFGQHLRIGLDLERLQDERRRLELRLKEQDIEVPESLLNDLVEGDPAVVGHMQRIAALEQQLKAMEAVFKDPNHPRLVQLRSEIQEERKALEKAKAEARPRWIERAKEQVRLQMAARLAALQEQIAQLESSLSAVLKDLEQKRAELRSLGRDAEELSFLRKELEKYENVYNAALEELTKLQVEAKAPSRAEILVKATPPRTRDNSRKIKLVGLASVASFGIVVLAIGLIEWKRRAVLIPDDIEKEARLRVIATVPRLPAPSRLHNGRYEQEMLRFEEAFDGVRVTLFAGRNGDAPKVIMVTSPESKEGKTTLAAHLAASVVRSGKRVIAVDLDLRSPSLHQLFDVDMAPGVVEVLAGAVELERALHMVERYPDLHVLPTGRPTRDVGGLLASGALGRLVGQLRRNYDFVVLDVPPVLIVPDALDIGQFADAAVLTALQGGTKAPALQEARKRLELVNIPLLGVVMLGVRQRGFGYYRGYGYGYGYGYGQSRQDLEQSADTEIRTQH